MSMKIKADSKNDLIKRRELQFELEAPKTPSFAEMQQQIAEQTKSSAESVVVKSIRSWFGTNTFIVEAFVYTNAEDKKRFEPKSKTKKDAAGGAK